MFDQTLDLFLLDPAPEIKVIKILCSHLAEIVQQLTLPTAKAGGFLLLPLLHW